MINYWRRKNTKLSAALVRNKAEKLNLAAELQKIEWTRRSEIRALESDKEKFRNKYFRESVSSPAVIDISKEYSEQFHNLIFTDDEIDIQKILCLYLISAHRTETLAPQSKKIFHVSKIHSPIERLLDRSKKKAVETKLVQNLPLYTLELPDFDATERKESKNNDGRLATRILLNEKIRDLVNSVLTALEQANHDKFEEIVEIMNDLGGLEQMFEDQNVSKFLEEIRNFPVINSCEFFVLTPPYKTRSIQLPIKTKDGHLEKLLKDIRQNLLQIPSKNVKPSGGARGDTREPEEEKDKIPVRGSKKKMALVKPAPQQVIKASVTVDPKELNEYQPSKYSSLNFEPQKNRSYTSGTRTFRHASTETNQLSTNTQSAKDIVENMYSNMQMTRNFVRKNIQEAGKPKRISSLLDAADDEEIENIELIKHKNRKYSSALRRNFLANYSSNYDDYYLKLQPIMLKGKMLNKIGRYGENNLESKIDTKNNETQKLKLRDKIRVSIKQTKCLACMQKWKTPLPSPKIPSIKKNILIPPSQIPNIEVNSQRRVSALIDREMFKLHLYERNFANEEIAKKVSMRRKALENDPTDYINLSPIELAKIEQEVREKETQKKLQKFLNE